MHSSFGRADALFVMAMKDELISCDLNMQAGERSALAEKDSLSTSSTSRTCRPIRVADCSSQKQVGENPRNHRHQFWPN